MSHGSEDIWNERIEHGMPWLPGYEIPLEFRGRYIPVGPRIRLVFDETYAHYKKPDPLDSFSWEVRFKAAYIKYVRLAALNAAKCPWYLPNLKTRFDKVRYWLHLKLIEWKVII